MNKYSLSLFVILSLSSCRIDRVHAAEADTETAETQTCVAGSSTENNGTCLAVDVSDKHKVSGHTKYPGCGLYIAKSTIPNAGVGIFTAVAKKPMDPLGSGDICIPNIDIKYHGNVFDPFKDYMWSGFVMGMTRESHANEIDAYCMGLDSAVNCNLALINTHRSIPTYDNSGLHRARDPGVGAFTPYHNGTTYASRHIPAGGGSCLSSTAMIGSLLDPQCLMATFLSWEITRKLRRFYVR
jgi:hypothetical protein